MSDERNDNTLMWHIDSVSWCSPGIELQRILDGVRSNVIWRTMIGWHGKFQQINTNTLHVPWSHVLFPNPKFVKNLSLLVERKRLLVPIALMRWPSLKKPLIEPLLWRKFGGGQFGPHSRLPIRQNLLPSLFFSNTFRSIQSDSSYVYLRRFKRHSHKPRCTSIMTYYMPNHYLNQWKTQTWIHVKWCALFRSSFCLSFSHIFQSYSGPYPNVTIDTVSPCQAR